MGFWLMSLMVLPAPCIAQLPEVPNRRLAVDCVKTEQFRFYGFLLGSDSKQLTLAVERVWLQNTYPEFAAEQVEKERLHLAALSQKYKQRIDEWIKQRSKYPALTEALNEEQARIIQVNQPELIANKKFVILTFDPKQVEQVFHQEAAHKQWAALAWHHDLSAVTSQPADDLRKQLQDLPQSLEEAQVKLAAELPSCPLTDDQWEIRKALFEYSILGEMEFQGMNQFLIRSFDAGPSDLLRQLMRSGNDTLQQLLDPKMNQPKDPQDWKASVCKQAEQKEYCSVMVKRTLTGLDGTPTAVEILFLAKVADVWEPLLKVQEPISLAAPTEEELKRLTADPQVQQILQSISLLGLDANSPLIQQALNRGVQVQVTLEAANKKMNQMVGRNTLYLDLPFTLPREAE